MERRIAKLIADNFELNGSKISVLEAMAMTKISSDGPDDIYAMQKGKDIFLATVFTNEFMTGVVTKVV